MIEMIDIYHAIVIGFTSFFFSMLLDSAMDKGNLLDFVRVFFAKKTGIEDEVFMVADGLSFSDRQDMYDSIYWGIAENNKWFTVLLCRKCLGVWVNLFFVLLALFIIPFSPVTLIFSTGLSFFLNVKL